MYYLYSRYYNPEMGRFISADVLVGTSLAGTNLFAYCENDPINKIDPYGYCGACVPGVYYVGNSISCDMIRDQYLEWKAREEEKEKEAALKNKGPSEGEMFLNCVETVGDYINDLIWDFWNCIEIEAGIGYGVGASAEVLFVDVNAILQGDIIHATLSQENALELTQYTYCSLNLACPIGTFGPTSESQCSFLDRPEIVYPEEYLISNKVQPFSIGASAYLIIGGNVSVNFYWDRFIDKLLYGD